MSGDAVTFTTPVGRFINGDPFTPQTTDYHGKPREKPQWYIGVAFAKTDPQIGQIIQMIQQTAMRDFPGGEYNQQGFSWKMDDGDDPKHQGKEGWAGHFILKFTSSYQPKIVDQNNQQILDTNQLKTGYYVQVASSTKGNDQNGTSQAGMYLNLNMVKLVAYGQEIQVGPSAQDVFGAAPTQLPPGAMTTLPAAPGFTPPAAQPVGQPQMAQPVGQPQMAVPPTQAGMPGIAGVPGAPGQPMTTVPSPAAATAQPSSPQLNVPPTPPAGTPGAPVTTGLPQPGVPGAVPGPTNPAGGPIPGASPTASPSSLQAQGVQPQPGFLVPPGTGQ